MQVIREQIFFLKMLLKIQDGGSAHTTVEAAELLHSSRFSALLSDTLLRCLCLQKKAG